MIRSLLNKISGSKNIFLYSCLLVAVVFLITRLQYFIYYPVLILSSDSASYCAAAFDIMDFNLPIFDIRTPGFPLFLSLVWTISKTTFASALIQSIVTLAASLFFIWVISKTYRSLTLLFALCLCGYIGSSYYVVLEPAILTEGIFTGLLLINSGLMIYALKKNKIGNWILYSVSVALLILVRPAALFLFALIILIIIFFLANKYKFKFYLSLVLPVSVILILLCSYNYFTLKKFTITPFGEANLMGVAILFMQPSNEYPAFVNDAIQNTLDSIPRSDINYVKKSNGISRLYHTFNENFYRQVNLTENLMKRDSTLSFVDIQPIIRKISVDAIKNNPLIYAKFFAANFLFFFNNIKSELDYYEQLSGIYKRTVVERKYTSELESGRWRQISSDKKDNEKVNLFFNQEIEKQKNLENIFVNEKGEIELKPTFAQSIFKVLESIFNFLFRNLLWILLYIVVLALSAYRLIRSRFKNIDALIPLLFCLIYLAKAILVSSVEVSLARYSYTVEFAVFFCLPFLILLLKNSKKKLSA